MTNCDIASTPANGPAMANTTKKFTGEPLYVRMLPGVRERMEALRGEQRIGDFARVLLEEALEAREIKRRERKA